MSLGFGKLLASEAKYVIRVWDGCRLFVSMCVSVAHVQGSGEVFFCLEMATSE